MSAAIELSAWVEKLKTARTRSELFGILDQFRAANEWTDEQCASIAKLYIRILDYLPNDDEGGTINTSSSGGPAKPAEQEEVWYEKM
ncbi:MAG TPA: hypothetical protein V6C76_12590 [Drouetiella sp.]